MKKILVFFLVSIFITKYCWAQNGNKKSNIFRVGIEAPLVNAKLSWEKELSKSFTIVTSGAFVTSYFDRTGLQKENFTSGVSASTMLSVEGRYYFTTFKRIEKHKNVSNFSATYISLQPSIRSAPFLYKYESDKEHFPSAISIYVNMGSQRQLKHGFYFDASAGVGLVSKSLKTSERSVYPFRLGFTFGYVINHKDA